jgi:thiamine-phosphate pyrophosphorylase
LDLPPFYPILDTAWLASRGLGTVAAAEAILGAGATILQFRHKTHFSRQAFQEAEQIAEFCCQAGALFVVNDRADIAALLGSALHLGQEDLLPADARKLLPVGAAIGFSTHNETQLRAAGVEPIDYVALGPMFGTTSKLNPDPIVGIEGLRALRPLTTRPLVAIGGITLESAPAVLAAGADSVAIISDLLPESGTLKDLTSRTKQWLQLRKQ